MSTAIFWFRQDLRCRDHPALTLACQRHKWLIPLYIKELDPIVTLGGAQKWWLHHSLLSLQKSLQQVHLDLYLRAADPLELLKELIQQHAVEAVYWSRCYEPAHRDRDQVIKAELKAQGVEVISCNSALLHEPWEILNKSGEYFKVFTPYWRSAAAQVKERPLYEINLWPKAKPIASEFIGDWNLIPKNPNWAVEFSHYWQPGESGALSRLEQFITSNLDGYKANRNIPSLSATSGLSPHLHFGEISPYLIWRSMQELLCCPSTNRVSIETFLAELGWREFSYQLLYHVPKLPSEHFKKQFDAFPWQQDDMLLHCWQHGLTGYPIVDAGMRELWRTGFMHNRVRMIAASFLTKDLLIDWREGAAWFLDTLVDADLANNSASWQWVAGSGADAAPYYRVFNPVLQGEKFDPNGDYVRRWVPELASIAPPWIHHPWDAPKGGLNVVLGKDYPLPIVDHAAARQVALRQYRNLTSNALLDHKKEDKHHT
jgi:deoxyribodipyrimidine photo-lyase